MNVFYLFNCCWEKKIEYIETATSIYTFLNSWIELNNTKSEPNRSKPISSRFGLVLSKPSCTPNIPGKQAWLRRDLPHGSWDTKGSVPRYRGECDPLCEAEERGSASHDRSRLIDHGGGVLTVPREAIGVNRLFPNKWLLDRGGSRHWRNHVRPGSLRYQREQGSHFWFNERLDLT